MLKENRQSKPGSPVPDQTLRTSFGCIVPRSGQDWFPVSETSRHPRRFTATLLRFWISTYSVDLLTATITREPLLGALVAVAVAGGGSVTVGRGVPVAVGRSCVAVGLPVGRGVSVGNAVGGGNVGKGVNVGKSKSNRAVGVGWFPGLGNPFGLGIGFGELREGKRLTRIEQRQQNTSTSKAGSRILPT